MSQPRTPFLHDLVTTFAAPTQVLSDRSGQIGTQGMAVGAQGVLHADVRVLSAIEVTVDGETGEHIATRAPAGRLRRKRRRPVQSSAPPRRATAD